jgi:hypothetical protein
VRVLAFAFRWKDYVVRARARIARTGDEMERGAPRAWLEATIGHSAVMTSFGTLMRCVSVSGGAQHTAAPQRSAALAAIDPCRQAASETDRVSPTGCGICQHDHRKPPEAQALGLRRILLVCREANLGAQARAICRFGASPDSAGSHKAFALIGGFPQFHAARWVARRNGAGSALVKAKAPWGR